MDSLQEKLSRIIEPERISTSGEYLDELSWDALSQSRFHPRHQPALAAPLLAVAPVCTEEVRQIVCFANRERLPIVPFGGGSGLMGGALSIRAGVVMDLRRMNRVLHVDAESRSARVQAGAVLEAVDLALNPVGFILGHDPWTVPVATVGGAISTNSVGYRAGIYGSMGDQVLGLEAVMPTGEVLQTRPVAKHSAGINLNALLVGGEGCFGIVTEATIRIFPKPETRIYHAYLFATFEQGYRAIQELFQRSLRPALLDFGDDADKHGGAILYLVFEGNRELTAAEEKQAGALCQAHGGKALVGGEAEQFWRDRHEIARRFARNRRQRREPSDNGVYRDWIHVALPSSRVLAFRNAAQDIVVRHGVHLQESGLWVQPELFSMRLCAETASVANPQLVLEEAIEELLRLVQEMGGSMEYTHGVGVKLAPLMSQEHGYGLQVMRQIKQALDPNNILNPGKMDL